MSVGVAELAILIVIGLFLFGAAGLVLVLGFGFFRRVRALEERVAALEQEKRQD